MKLFQGRPSSRPNFRIRRLRAACQLDGHLEQIHSYAPGHQISFRNLNYVADIRGDLSFEGFAAPIAALALDPEQAIKSEDGSLEPAGLSAIMELATGGPEGMASSANPKTNRTPLDAQAPDTPPDSKSEPSGSVLSRCDHDAPTPDSPADSLSSAQTSPLNEALDLMRSLAITEGSLPNYAQAGLGAEGEGF